MKTSFKKVISLLFVVIFALSCFGITALATDAEPAETGNFLQRILTFLFGETAFVDGKFNFGSILHALYYKDSPIFMKIYDVFYHAFWDTLIAILNLFVK